MSEECGQQLWHKHEGDGSDPGSNGNLNRQTGSTATQTQ